MYKVVDSTWMWDGFIHCWFGAAYKICWQWEKYRNHQPNPSTLKAATAIVCMLLSETEIERIKWLRKYQTAISFICQLHVSVLIMFGLILSKWVFSSSHYRHIFTFIPTNVDAKQICLQTRSLCTILPQSTLKQPLASWKHWIKMTENIATVWMLQSPAGPISYRTSTL